MVSGQLPELLVGAFMPPYFSIIHYNYVGQLEHIPRVYSHIFARPVLARIPLISEMGEVHL